MNTNPNCKHLSQGLPRIWNGFIGNRPGRWFASLLLVGAAASAQTYTNNFNSGTDAGLTHYDPILAVTTGVLPEPMSSTTYSFPSDGSGGSYYRVLSAPLTQFEPALGLPPGTLGPARSFSFVTNNMYTRFQASVNLVNWDKSVDQAFGLFCRANPVYLASTYGYVVNYNSQDANLQINKVQDEGPAGTIAETPMSVQPENGPYRLAISGGGGVLVGQVYGPAEPRVPIASVVALDDDATRTEGMLGMFVFDRNDQVTTYTYCDVTFDNYATATPAAGALRPTVVEATPVPGGPITFQTKVAILNRDTTVVTNSIVLSMDGVVVPSSSYTLTSGVVMPNNAVPFGGVTLVYTPTTIARATEWHTNRVVFQDSAGATLTNEWAFKYPVLDPANARPVGSGIDPGFNVRLVQTFTNVTLANSVSRAEDQLAVPPLIPVDVDTNTTVAVINYTKNPLPSNDGYFADFEVFPSWAIATNINNIALEATAYLELAVGTYRFGVRSDDGVSLRSGASLADKGGLTLVDYNGVFDGTSDFYVDKAGLYPFRLVWEQGGGGAHVEIFSVNPGTGTRTLINDAAAGSIKAYQKVAVALAELYSSATVNGTYAKEANAVVDELQKQITVPVSGATRFYQIRAGSALRITSINVTGGNVILGYQ